MEIEFFPWAERATGSSFTAKNEFYKKKLATAT
jgi:hypothetical protein